MKISPLFSLFCVSAVVFAAQVVADVPSEPVSLFNGKDLSGWVIENGGQFSVEDGKIKVNRGTGWLRSEETYGDYILHIEFRFLEEGANSGIFLRTGASSHEDEKGYPDNGYQLQCYDTLEGDHPIATLIQYGAPEFEQSFSREALERAYRPASEWQSYTIVALGESLKIYLNDVPVTLATSIENREGHIGIQGELGLLEFRKLELRAL